MTTITQTDKESNSNSNTKSIQNTQFKYTDFLDNDNISFLTLEKPKVNTVSKLGNSIPVKFRKGYFTLQLPKLRTPFGITFFDETTNNTNGNDQPREQPNESSKEKRWTITLSLDEDEAFLKRNNDFKQVILDMDSQFIEEASKKDDIRSFFGKDKKGCYYGKEIIESKMVSSIFKKQNKKDNSFYPDTFRTKINDKSASKFQTNFYNPKLELLSIDYTDLSSPNYCTKVVPPNSRCIILVSASCWATNASWGVRWNAQQVIVFPPTDQYDNSICHINPSVEDLEEDPVDELDDPSADPSTDPSADPSIDPSTDQSTSPANEALSPTNN